jgi:hypothetical protein
MRRVFLAALMTLWIYSAFAVPVHARHLKAAHHSQMKKYHAEHGARMHRHRTLTPAQRRARMKKYAAEHRARQHRHRAHLKAQRMKH